MSREYTDQVGNTFYWGTTKNLITSFGTLFSDIHILRRAKDSVNGEIVQDIRVPISLSNRDKFFDMATQSINGQDREKQVRSTFPRIGFELSGFSYDSSRKKSSNQKVTCIDEDRNYYAVNAPAPWNIDIEMYIVSTNQEDCLQIVEQILPKFNPDRTLTIKGPFELPITVPLTLTSLSVTDEYEGDYTTQRLVTYSITFQAKLDYYGKIIKSDKLIYQVDQLYSDNDKTKYGSISTKWDNDNQQVVVDVVWNDDGTVNFDVNDKQSINKNDQCKSPTVRVNSKDL